MENFIFCAVACVLLNADFNYFIIAYLVTFYLGLFSLVFQDSKEFSDRAKRCKFSLEEI